MMWDMRPHSTWLLVGAVGTEVVGTLALRVSDGFTRPLPTVGTLAGYGVSLWLFSLLLDRGGTALGAAYAVLTGAGLVAATAASVLLFGDPLSTVQALGLVLLGAGVLLVQTTRPVAAP